jgi:hypothetical protein
MQLEGSYWKQFHHELTLLKKHEATSMCVKSFEILQNTEHCQAMQHDTSK